MQHRMKCYRHKSNYIKVKEETMQNCNIYKLLPVSVLGSVFSDYVVFHGGRDPH